MATAAKKAAPTKAAAKPAAEKPATAVKVTVYEELVKAAGSAFAVKKGEDHDAWAARICEKLSELEDAKFEKLSKAAQTWFNEAVEAINNEKTVKTVAGFPAGSAPAKKAEKPAATKAEKPAKAEKAPKAEKPAKPAGPKPTSSNKDSVAYKMRLQVVKNPAITFEDALVKAKVDEPRGGNAFNAWQNAKHVMAIYAEENPA